MKQIGLQDVLVVDKKTDPSQKCERECSVLEVSRLKLSRGFYSTSFEVDCWLTDKTSASKI
jgi:hypothetical protein